MIRSQLAEGIPKNRVCIFCATPNWEGVSKGHGIDIFICRACVKSKVPGLLANDPYVWEPLKIGGHVWIEGGGVFWLVCGCPTDGREAW